MLFTSPLADRERKELERLARMPGSEIDYSDTPAMKSRPARVQVGRFYKPVKQHISLRVDAAPGDAKPRFKQEPKLD